MKQSLMILTMLLFIIPTLKAEYAGRVFQDKNSNGIYDNGEPGIKGVRVSDGLNVIETNANGVFKLKGSSITRFIFITVPAGYKTTQKHFLPVQTKSESYNFGLAPFPATANKTRFIQITDTETYEYGDWIDNLRDYSKFNEVGFIVHTGDICYEKGLKFHAENINSETMGLPVFYCIGNHDLVKGDYGEQLFESLFGPVYYSFDAGNTHFIVTPMRSGDHKPSYNNNQVFNWLVNDLAFVDPSKNVVVFNHDLLTFDEQFIFSGKGKREINLNEHNLIAWIYGHWHINFVKKHGENGPISVSASPPDKGGIDHSPSNFVVFDITKNGEIDIAPRYSYLSKHIEINAPARNDILLNILGNLVVSVNTYHTVSKTKNVSGTLIYESGETEEFSLLQNSDWNWSAEIQLDKKWKNGELKLIIESTFENGETVKQERSYGILTKNISLDNLKMKWITNEKGNIWMAPPVEAKGKVFVATIDDFGMKECGIHAVDAESGFKLWDFKTEGSVKNTFCYSDGKILTTDVFGISYALDAETGKLIWKKELGQQTLGSFNTGSVVENGIFYTGFGNYLQAVEVETGKTIWINEEWQGGEGATPTMIVADNVLIAASNWRALYAHDIKTGKLLWKKSDNGYSSRSSSATFLNDTLYVASKDGIGLMNVHSGEMYKYFKSPHSLLVTTKPLIANNLIIMGTAKNGLAAFNRATGEEMWKVQTGKSLVYSSPYSKPESATVESAPVLFNDKIIFGASDGFLYVVNLNDGAIIQKINLGAPVFASVTPYLNGFFIADFGGNIYRFLLRNSN